MTYFYLVLIIQIMTTELGLQLKQKINEKLQLELNTNPTILYNGSLHDIKKSFQFYFHDRFENMDKMTYYNGLEYINTTINEYILKNKLNISFDEHHYNKNCDFFACNKTIEEQKIFINNCIYGHVLDIFNNAKYEHKNQFGNIQEIKINPNKYNGIYKITEIQCCQFIFLIYKEFNDFKIETTKEIQKFNEFKIETNKEIQKLKLLLKTNLFKEIIRLILFAMLLYFFNKINFLFNYQKPLLLLSN